MEAGSADLSDFALAAKRYMESVQRGPELAHNACVVRQDGPWKSGSTYLVTVSTDGRVFFHAAKAALGGRPLKRPVWAAIAAATGAAALRTTGSFGNPNGGALPAQIGGGYAVGFQRAGASPIILVVGLDIGEAHLDTETIDPGDPTVRADEVVDRATLQTFVNEAMNYVLTTFRSEGRAAFTQVKSVLRDPNGPWRHGPVYLFIMEPTGYTIFHGAFPDRFEFRRPTDTLRDEVTGRLILPQIIRTATTSEDGGFVQYYFDNPDDPNDDFNTLKVTYARQHVFRSTLADGSTFEYPLIFGAGIYGDPDATVAQGCPLPAGVSANPLATPSITAEQVEAGTADLSDFALAAKRYMESVQRGPELAHNACVVRQDGPWKSGSTYLVTVSTDGRVFFHAAKAALGGRPLKRTVYGAILRALGITATTPVDVRTALANVAETGSFPNSNGGQIPGVGGYAVGFQRAGASPLILVVGLDIGEAHLDTETIDPGDPTVRADQVVDRATLKTFVKEARDYVLSVYRSQGRAAFSQVKSVLRDPNGPWRHGPVYLFMMEPTGYTIFHGAFPDRFEFRRPTDTLRDQVTNQLILPQIIRTATTSEDGGYVEYYFDNPDDPNDDFNTLKVTYAIQHPFEATLADGSTFQYPLIFGAGIYGDPSTVAEDVCPRPAGLPNNPLATPGVTAAQAAAGGDSLRDFALAGRDYFNSITTPTELAYAGCLIRNEGPWKSGSTYIVALTLDGRVLLHGQDMSTGGRPLQPAIYASILAALGITGTSQADYEAALGQVFANRAFPNADGGEIPGIGGYAVGYGIHIPYILLAGVDLQEQHFAPDTVDPGDPEVSADEVVDRATLKAFVNGAIDYLLNLYQTNPAGTIGIARSILRNPPWRSGPTYLFIMEESGYTLLHAGFPDRFEFQTPTQTLRDQVTGELILPQIIEAAKGGGEEGAFVQYYFDNPDDPDDDFNTRKLTYARQLTFSVPGGQPVSYIVGAGIYGEDDNVVSEESVAATRGWLARFGRAVGSQAVEAISSRLNSSAPAGMKMTLAGQNVNFDADSTLPFTEDGLSLFEKNGLVLWDGKEGAAFAGGAPAGERRMALSDLLMRSSFHFAATEGAADVAGGRWSAWGRGARTSFDGGGAASIGGDVTTAMLGMDYELGRFLTGVAVSHARGEGDFQNEGRSEIEAMLTSVHPYLRYAVSERLSMWGILGLGRGEMTLDDKESEQKIDTDIEMSMGAFGVRGALLKTGGVELAVKSDLLLTQVEADEKDGLESISASTSRFRGMVEASRAVALESGGSLRPSVEAGLRHDGGDAEEGAGLELGGRIRYTNPAWGLTMEVSGRGLMAHAEDGAREWGVDGSLRLAPGAQGRGLSLKMGSTWGEASSGVERLWSQRSAADLARDGEEGAASFDAEVGYGLSAPGGGLLTPYGGLTISNGGTETYRAGGRLKIGRFFSMSLEGDRRERIDDDPDHGVMLRGVLRW